MFFSSIALAINMFDSARNKIKIWTCQCKYNGVDFKHELNRRGNHNLYNFGLKRCQEE